MGSLVCTVCFLKGQKALNLILTSVEEIFLPATSCFELGSFNQFNLLPIKGFLIGGGECLQSFGWLLLSGPSARQHVGQETGISTLCVLFFCCSLFLTQLLWCGFLHWLQPLQRCISFWVSSQPLLRLLFALAFLLLSCLPSRFLLRWHGPLFFSSSFYNTVSWHLLPF